MPTDPRVDQYIAKSPEFAKPILRYLRELIHKGCADTSEDIKWGRPAFIHRNKILCGISAFKAHSSLFIFQAEISKNVRENGGHLDGSAGALGRTTQIADLPPRQELLGYIREAVRLLDAPLSSPAPRKRTTRRKPEARIPDDLAVAFAKNKKADEAFDGFSQSHRRKYIEWITEAKREDPRQKRIATALK